MNKLSDRETSEKLKDIRKREVLLAQLAEYVKCIDLIMPKRAINMLFLARIK